MSRTFFLVSLFFVALSTLSGQEEVSLSPAPGGYSGPQEVGVGFSGELEFRLGDSGSYLPLSEPIRLDALPGSVERYRLFFRVPGTTTPLMEASYTIDRRPPIPPRPLLPEGRYLAPISVRFEEREETTFEYRDAGIYREVPADGITLDPGSGRRQAYTLRVRSVDEVGNRSVSTELLYVVDRTFDTLDERGESYQIILSPRPGAYRNRQLILPEHRLWESVRYTLDGTDPREGTPLREHLLVPGTGEIELRIAGVSRLDGRYREERLVFSQESEVSPFPESGIYKEPVVVRPPEEGRYSFFLANEEPERRQLLVRALELAPPPGNRRVLRFSATPLGSNAPAYAHTYLLDDRAPLEPTLLLRRDSSETIRLSAFSNPDAHIRYEVQGVDAPGAYDYQGPTLLRLPPGSGSRVVRVTATSQLPGGEESGPVTRELRLSTEPPGPPTISLGDRLAGEPIDLFVDAPAPILPGPLGSLEERIPPNGLTEDPFLSYAPPPGLEGNLRLLFRSVTPDGWLSSDVVAVDVPVDTTPPERPSLRINEEGELLIDGAGALEYRVISDIEASPSNTRGFTTYEAPVTLTAPQDSVVRYTVEARSRDEAGNVSPTVSTSREIDAREATIPPIRGVQDGGRYREAELFLLFQNPYPGELRVFYEISRGDGEAPPSPPQPDRQSPSVTERLLIETPEQVERHYAVRLRSALPGGPLSQPEEITFTVDRIPPEPPRVELPASGSPFARDVELRLLGGEGERYIAVSRTEGADPLGPRGSRYVAPVRVTGEEGAVIRYTVTAASRDAAGNVGRLDESVTFIVDREPPPPPEIILEDTPREGSAIRSRPTELGLQGEGNLFISYGRVGRAPELLEYAGNTVELSGEEGAVIEYTVEAFALDPAGNRSPSRRLSLRIDRESPDRLPEPEIEYAPDGRSGALIWPELNESALFVARRDGVRLEHTEAEEGAIPIEGGVQWTLEPGRSEGTVTVFAEDPAGNRSPEQRISVTRRTEPPAPSFSGFPSESVTNEAVRLELQQLTEVQGTVRFSVSTDGTLPPTVTSESPLFGTTQRFTAGQGEAIPYVVAARAFNEDGEVSEPTVIRFTIDREPPPKPRIQGVISGEFYPDSQTFTLHGEGEIYYRIQERDSDVALEEAEFRVYQGEPLELSARDGELVAYQIQAYSRDEAGNRSQEIAQWQLFVDREIMYVSAASGSDTNDGSRSAPFGTLERAIEALISGDRSTIFLGEGSYVIRDGIEIDRSIRVIGGFIGEAWRPGDDGSSIRVLPTLGAGDEAEGEPVFRLRQNGSLTIRRVNLSSLRREPIARIIGGTSLFLEESNLDTSAPVAVELAGGSLRLEESQISVPRGGRSVKSTEGGSLRASNSELAPLDLSRTDYEISGSTVTATPVTTEAATAIIAAESRGLIRDSLLRADAREEHLLLADIRGGSFRLEGSEIVGDAGTGITLVRSSGSDIAIDRSDFEARGAQSYAYGIIGRDTRLTITNSIFLATGSESVLGFSMKGGSATVAQSTMIFNDLGRSFLFSVGSLSELLLLNSQVHRLDSRSNEDHTLVYLDGTVERLGIAGNNVSGWQRLITDGSVARSSWGFTSPGIIRRIEELHRATIDLPSVSRLEAYENISESAERTFAAGPEAIEQRDFSLQLGSRSLEQGVRDMPSTLEETLRRDYSGTRRPDTDRPDIGAVAY